jgi:hypothetical protein
MNASLAFGHGHTLHAMHARFPSHRAECAIAFDLEDCFLHPAERAIGLRDHFNAPAAPLGEARVHAV